MRLAGCGKTILPRPDTFNPDLFAVLLFQAHAQGRPELADFNLAQMVQTLAWCHGSKRGHPRLTGSTIDGRHHVTISHTAWLSTCPDLTRSTVNRVLAICSEDRTPGWGAMPCLSTTNNRATISAYAQTD